MRGAHRQRGDDGPIIALADALGCFLFASSRPMNVSPEALLFGTAILPLARGDPAKSPIADVILVLVA